MAACLLPSPSRLRDLAIVFAGFGNFTFGGGSAMIAVLRDEIVVERGWLATLDVDLSFPLSRLTPGKNLNSLRRHSSSFLVCRAASCTTISRTPSVFSDRPVFVRCFARGG